MNTPVRAYVVLAPGTGSADIPLPALLDASGEFQAAYDATGGCGYLIRPDGYIGYRAGRITAPELLNHLGIIFAK